MDDSFFNDSICGHCKSVPESDALRIPADSASTRRCSFSCTLLYSAVKHVTDFIDLQENHSLPRDDEWLRKRLHTMLIALQQRAKERGIRLVRPSLS